MMRITVLQVADLLRKFFANAPYPANLLLDLRNAMSGIARVQDITT